MTNLFQTILQMSITGSIVILCVYTARILLRKAPKIFSYALWTLVLFRLLCPVTMTSPVSLIPKTVAQGEYEAIFSHPGLSYSDHTDTVENIHTAVETQTNTNSDRLPNFTMQTGDTLAPLPEHMPALSDTDKPLPEQNSSLADPLTVPAYIWGFGLILMTVYSIFSFIWIYRKVRICIHIKENIYIAEDIDTPFTLGFIKPKIYLPTGLSEKETDYIIAHEKHHIKRCDPIIKLAAFLALSIHWFNPLVWLAFYSAGKDMEMSCDEAVMKAFPKDIREEYSSSLLRLAAGKHRISMVPLAFGENNIRARIINVMHYKKPVVWIAAAALIVCGILSVTLITDPESKTTDPDNISTEISGEETVTPEDETNDVTETAISESTSVDVTKEEHFVKEYAIGELTYKIMNVNKMYADITGDGIDDFIQLTVPVDYELSDYDPKNLARYIKHVWASVSVYRGSADGQFTEEPIWTSFDYSTAHAGNGQLSVVTKDDKEYLLESSLWSGQGGANYSYKVFSLTESGEEIVVDHYDTGDFTFDTGGRNPYTQNWPLSSMILPEFYNHLKEWIQTGTLIIAADIGLSDYEVNELMYSITDPQDADSYHVVTPTDYYHRAFHTRFTTQYFRCDFPPEWAGQIYYRETHDGMVMEIYYKKASDLAIVTETKAPISLLGKLFLVPVGQTAADMTTYFLTPNEIAHARYIGVNIDGRYMPMVCPSDNVISPMEFTIPSGDSWHDQAAAEAYEEFFELGAHFMDSRITAYAIGINNPYSSGSLPAYGRYSLQYPEYGFGDRVIAAPNQPLALDEEAARKVLFSAKNQPGNAFSLTIDGKEYSSIFAEVWPDATYNNAVLYTTVDLNPNDNSTEILIYYSDLPGYEIHVFSMEGDNLSYLGHSLTPEFMNAVSLHNDGTFTVLEHRMYIENNAIPVTYSINGESLAEVPKEEYPFFYLRYHDVIKDFEVFTDRDLTSEKTILKTGEKVCFTKAYSSGLETDGIRFFELITEAGDTYYAAIEGDTYLYDYVGGLNLAG